MTIIRRFVPILAESALLAFLFLGIGGSAGVFWHASAGLALPFSWFSWHEIAAPGAPTDKTPRPVSGDSAPPRTRAFTAGVGFPSHVFLKVPFSPQAPHGNWGQPYKDACEETSVAMAMAWVRGANALPPAAADSEIRTLIAYERHYFGYDRDTTLRETAKLFTRAYGYDRVRVDYDMSLSDIKAELAAGNLILLPAAGALLQNPYFPTPPPYHMVVVTGYDDVAQEFIVNDPGTRNGENYRYSYDVLWNAVHDWTGDRVTILDGRRGMIVVLPPEAA